MKQIFLLFFCLSIFPYKLDKKDAGTSELSNRIEINKHTPQQHCNANIKASPDLLYTPKLKYKLE